MGYDSSYILESCNKNNIHISDKIKEKLANKFNILEIENKTRENKINESFNHVYLIEFIICHRIPILDELLITMKMVEIY